jgi:hypothetical protein
VRLVGGQGLALRIKRPGRPSKQITVRAPGSSTRSTAGHPRLRTRRHRVPRPRPHLLRRRRIHTEIPLGWLTGGGFAAPVTHRSSCRTAPAPRTAPAGSPTTGSTDAWPIIRITGPCANVSIIHVASGRVLALPTLNLAAGRWVELDTRPGYRTVHLGQRRQRLRLPVAQPPASTCSPCPPGPVRDAVDRLRQHQHRPHPPDLARRLHRPLRRADHGPVPAPILTNGATHSAQQFRMLVRDLARRGRHHPGRRPEGHPAGHPGGGVLVADGSGVIKGRDDAFQGHYSGLQHRQRSTWTIASTGGRRPLRHGHPPGRRTPSTRAGLDPHRPDRVLRVISGVSSSATAIPDGRTGIPSGPDRHPGLHCHHHQRDDRGPAEVRQPAPLPPASPSRRPRIHRHQRHHRHLLLLLHRRRLVRRHPGLGHHRHPVHGRRAIRYNQGLLRRICARPSAPA